MTNSITAPTAKEEAIYPMLANSALEVVLHDDALYKSTYFTFYFLILAMST